MIFRRFIYFFILVFGFSAISNSVFSQGNGGESMEPTMNKEVTKDTEEPKEKTDKGEAKKGINITELVFGHVSDAHDWHLFSVKHDDEGGLITPVVLPLPIIVYQPGRGFSAFMSSNFVSRELWKEKDEKTTYSNSFNGYHLEMYMKEKIVADSDPEHPEYTGKVYDLSITKNILSMLIGITLLFWAMLSVAKKYKTAGVMKSPSGFQNAIEVIIIFIRDEVAIPNLGKRYMKFLPLLLSIFFFIWINNLLGLLPGGANFTGNVAVTSCLALISFIVMMVNSNKHFWGHLLNPPNVPFLVKGLLVLIEIMSLFIKPVALMIRLFANMLAGHIVILIVICMIFIFGTLNKYIGLSFIPFSLAFAIFMFMLELLVAAIQAFIFINLTAVFVGQAIEGAHEEGDSAHGEPAKAH